MGLMEGLRVMGAIWILGVLGVIGIIGVIGLYIRYSI